MSCRKRCCWLPEPIVTNASDDPARHAEMAELESLSPEQRRSLSLAMLVCDRPQVVEQLLAIGHRAAPVISPVGRGPSIPV